MMEDDDGQFDYGALRTAEIEYAVCHIDGEKFPKNLANARKTLAARKLLVSAEPPAVPVAKDTWLQARLRELLSPRGRLSRRGYWLFFIILLLVSYLNMVQARLFGTPNLSVPIQLITLWPVLVVLSRRFQDVNLSGWWACLYFVPAIFFGAILGPIHRLDLIGYSTLVKCVGLVILGLIPTHMDRSVDRREGTHSTL